MFNKGFRNWDETSALRGRNFKVGKAMLRPTSGLAVPVVLDWAAAGV